jgi:hypothetical protein
MTYVTGIKDLDEKLLNEVDDVSLGRMCQTNSKVKSICDNDQFWRRRIYLLFGDKAEKVLKAKEVNETYRDFYTSQRFLDYKAHVYPICAEIESLPHNSQMVIDDFYNPETGFVNIAFTRDQVGITYLLLKIVYGRLLKDGNMVDADKLKKVIDEQKLNIPEYRFPSFHLDSYELTKREKQLFSDLINIDVGRPSILKSVATRNSKFVKSLKNAPKSFALIAKLHNGFRKGEIPFDIKWSELCTFPQLVNGLNN